MARDPVMTMTGPHNRSAPIAASFDSAEGYDNAARVQAIAASRLAGMIELHYRHAGPPRRILELGCGTGALTRRLRALFPQATLTALDLSPKMIARARQVVPDATYQVMDAEYPALEGSFDLICSSFCIQWFSDRSAAFTRLSRLLAPGGRIEVTTLAAGSFAQWHEACTACGVPSGFPDYPDTTTLQAEWPDALCGTWQTETLRDTVGSARGFLRDLRAIGATTPRPGATPLSPGQLRQVMTQFDRMSDVMDYQVGYGAARKPRGVFVTGTDTGIGKTLVSAILTSALKATYWKPFQTGLADESGDTASVTYLAGLSPDRVIPPAYGFQAPLSPQDASALEQVTVRLETVSLPETRAPLVVEGAGGLMVPLNDTTLLVDWLATLDMPAVLVCRSGLGTINHTLLSIEALRQRGIAIAGVIMSGTPNSANRAAITRFGKVDVLAEIPLLEEITPESVAREAAALAVTLSARGWV